MSLAIKICGVCSAADAAMISSAGADYVGVILSPGSGRSRTPEEASSIFAAAAAYRVGVFVDRPLAEVRAAVARLALDVVQLHGRETPTFVASLGDATDVRIWKTLAVRGPDDIERAEAFSGLVQGILLEGASAQRGGGVGASFDWAAAAAARAALPADMQVVLAGGLDAGNVGRAVSLLRPDVVDVSSGVEEARCRKSAQRTQRFIAAARAAAVTEGLSG